MSSTDTTHPAVAEVLAIYRAAIRDDDVPEDLAARYVAATLRWAAPLMNCLDDCELLRDEADHIEATR